MKIQLINKPSRDIKPHIQVLLNRGIAPVDLPYFLNSTDNVINSPHEFGDDKLAIGAKMLIKNISENKTCLVVVDSDCDGYTSSSILINYLHDLFPAWVENNLKWFIHSGKQHGLSDCIDIALKYDIIILPDSSSNDYQYHQRLKENNIDILVLDHHEAPYISSNACVINNQLSDYPNKDFSGAGVTWQFCRYLDELLCKDNAEQYIDMCALGLIADMMSMTSLETKHVIMKGISNIQNPFFEAMVEKNSYSIGEDITPIGIAFYVAPYVNAMVRSGEFNEKDLLFRSMLKYKAYDKIPSTKRGHKQGEMETVLAQALRTVTNVKNRQTRAQDAGLTFLENMIKENNLLEHKALILTLKAGQVDKNIAGLISNKFMSKYQRPCAILTLSEDGKYYQGSARGYTKSGFTNFKEACSMCPGVTFAEGHANAFGLGVESDKIEEFIAFLDEMLKYISTEPVYRVDYVFDYDYCDQKLLADCVLDVASLNSIWGQGIEESLFFIDNLEITEDMVQIFEKKENTIKINLSNGLNLMKFHATDEECNLLKRENDGVVSLSLVGTCHRNEWGGNINPQLYIEDYEVVYRTGYIPKVEDF